MGNKSSSMPGVEIQIIRDINEKMHFHSEIELVFVISGSLFINLKNESYQLSSKDIILFNPNVLHQICSTDNALICKILISYKILSKFIKNGNYIFECNSVKDNVNSYKDLENVLKRIVFSYLEKEHKTECLRYGLIYELVDILIEQFQKNEDYYRYKDCNKENDRIQYIINYVNLNFQNSISLNDLAQKMYTSQSTLSRFFKKHMGIYFGEFVNEVRLNYAIRDLIETDKTITKISIDCGFSNASIFSKSFQNKYKISPTKYRKQQLAVKDSMENDKDIDVRDFREDIILLEEKSKLSSKEIYIKTLINEGTSYKKFWNRVLNAGTAYNLILASVQDHITYLINQLNFEYVRLWNIFSYKLMIQKNNNDYDYNFSMVDNILDFLVNSGVKPFIDFGKKPDCAVVSEDETIYYEEEYINFNSMAEWKNMFNKFILHIIRRYGKEEVETWKFEFSFDIRPGSFCIKDNSISFYEFFKYNFCFIKKYIPNAKVGGFGIIESDYDRLYRLMIYCKENDCIPDFVSILLFPYSHIEENEKYFAKRITDHFKIMDHIKMMRNNLDKEGFETCNLYITEWNNSLSNRNYINDSCFRAAYVLKTINQLWDIPDMIGVWMCSDLASSYYDTSRIANGGSGLITKDKIRKPVFYAFLLLNRIGKKIIDKGENYIITSDDDNSYYILCFNYKEYNFNYFFHAENTISPENLINLFENNNDLKLDIDLIGMPENQRFIIKKYIINEECGSILKEWSKFEYEKDIEGNDLKHLIEVCTPDITMKKQIVNDNILKISTNLKSNEISLIHVYKEN